MYLGTLGIFTFGVLLFFKYIPMIAISEVKAVNKYQPAGGKKEVTSQKSKED
jgi:hypothetical protein